MEDILPSTQNAAPPDIVRAMEIVKLLLSGEVPTARDIQEKFQISFEEAVELMRNPTLVSEFRAIKEAQASIEFDFYGWNEQVRILKSEKSSDKDKIAAFKVMGDMLKRRTPTVIQPGAKNTFINNLNISAEEKRKVLSRTFSGFEEE